MCLFWLFMQTLSSVHAVSWPRLWLHQHHVPIVRDDEVSEDVKFAPRKVSRRSEQHGGGGGGKQSGGDC